MAFSPDTEKLAKELIQAEYENACKQAGKEFNDEYTDKYHSLYEGYAVLLEEVEETSVCVDSMKRLLDSIWDRIKKNLMTKDTYIAKQLIDRMLVISADTISELAQVGAVLMKIKNTISPVEKTENLEKTPKLVWHDYPNETPKHKQKVLIQDRYDSIYTASYYSDKKDCFSVELLTYGFQGCEFVANEQVKKWCDFPLEVKECCL